MNEMKIFENNEFGTIRIVCDELGNPWFCGRDVCEVLGYKNPKNAIIMHVEQVDKLRVRIGSSGQNRQLNFISESGLYSLILSSQLESARRFKFWVTSEVLPAIRQDGGYMVAHAEESDEVIMARAVHIMQKAVEKRDAQIAELKPKAEYADLVLDSVSCLTTTQIAKELDMTGIELNKLLCRKKIQYHQSRQYLLYAKYARRGYAKNRNFGYPCPYNGKRTRTYLVWTEKGRRFIHDVVKGVA